MNSSDVYFTSVDYYLNKFLNKSKKDIINLNELANKFKLDYSKVGDTYEVNGKFYKLEYSKKIGKGSVEELINRPPIGPIPQGFMCSNCEEYGQSYHSINCMNPDKKSLLLTYSGFKNLIKNVEYSGPLENDIKEYRAGKKIKIIKKYFDEDFLEERLDETTGKKIVKISDTAFSEIPYDDVIKTKGKDPQAPKTITTRYSNIVSIYYNYYGKTTNIRVYKDGSIDIKNIPQDETERNAMLTELIKRINETGTVNLLNFKELLRINMIATSDTYKKIDSISGFYLFHAQFYIFGEENRKEQEIKFDELEELLEPEDSNNYVNLIGDEYYLNIDGYDISIISKSKLEYSKKVLKSNYENKVYIIQIDSTSISLFITKYGVFQFSVSDNTSDIQQTKEILDVIRQFFINLFQENSLTSKTYITSESAIYSMKETQDTTISGLVPPKSKSQREGTEVCRKTQAGVELQPKPYSWVGTCANDNYAPAIGIADKYKGGSVLVDYNGTYKQLYYPCCEKLTGPAKLEFIRRLKEGFTSEEQYKYGIYPHRDYLSGILVPDSTKLAAKSKVILPGDDDYTEVIVIQTPKKVTVDSEYKVRRISDNKIFTVKRIDFEKDSRYFRGLNSLSKKQLIDILRKNNMISTGIKVDIPDNINYRYISKSDITEVFTEKIFKLTSVPNDTTLCILIYNKKSDQYYYKVESKTKITSDLKFLENTRVVGYINEQEQLFYPLYILGINDLETSTDLLENNLKSDENNIILPEFYDNYVEAADYLLKQNINTRLIFLDEKLETDLLYFDEKLIPSPIVIQLIEVVGASRYTVGYDGKKFTTETYQMNIPSINKPGSYMKVKGKYNKITNDINKLKPLEYLSSSQREDVTFEKANKLFNELFNPIDALYFTVNDGESLDGLTFDDETNKLIIS